MPRRARSPGRSVEHFELAGKQYARLGIALVPPLPAKLTAAEREVVTLILEGKSNAAIAKARGVAVRTVANQVASILRKLRVGSRSGLLARLTRDASDG
jgi:DNA-binding CsgD family transcriptional regulator